MNKGGQRIIGVDEIMLKTRFNPLVRSINMIKKIKNPYVRLKYTLEIAKYFYAPAKGDAHAPLSPSQSAANAQQAHKLLTALENNIKKQKKGVTEILAHQAAEVQNVAKEEIVEIRPLSGSGEPIAEGLPEGSPSSGDTGLGDGTPQVQA